MDTSPIGPLQVRLTPFAASGRDAFSTVRELRALEQAQFPGCAEADFGSFESDLGLLHAAPGGLVLALDQVDAHLVGFCWGLPLSAAGEARLLRGERDGGMGAEHLAAPDATVHAIYITSIALQPQARGLGLGRRLHDAALRALAGHHPAILLQTAWSDCGAALLRRYDPVQVGSCEGHPIYRVALRDAAMRPAA